MESLNILSKNSSLILIIFLSLCFVIFGVLYSKKYKGLNNYLIANKSVETFSLTTSLVASALGAWILFGPASAATWGGIGAVIGYSLGTALPFLVLFFIGEKFRKIFPKGKTLIEVIKMRFKKKLFKLILFLVIFYMFVFLTAEVTAVSMLIKYISGTNLWITSLIVIGSSLIYTLYGGLRASIFTDNIQFAIIIILLLFSFAYLTNLNSEHFNIEFIKLNKPILLSSSYLPNFTAGITFFIAVAATNLFHQGNWQRVYAAKSNKILKKSLIFSFFIIIPIVFFMGFSGLVSVSQNSNVIPDLAFFTLLLRDQAVPIAIIIIILSISLTVSSIDTLINAVSSLIIVDGNKVFSFKGDYFKISRNIIILLSVLAFIISSKGLSVLYMFLLADLFCCSAVLSVFYSFYNNKITEKRVYIAILIGLFSGLILFPSPDFSKSILIGFLFSTDNFPVFMSQSLLFMSFLVATFFPILAWKTK